MPGPGNFANSRNSGGDRPDSISLICITPHWSVSCRWWRALKILAIVTDAFGGYGGIAQYNRDLLSAFAALPQVDSVIAIPRLADPSQTVVLPKLVQLKPSRNRLVYAMRAAWLAWRMRPDAIFSGHVYHGPLALMLARALRCKLISQLHGDEVWTPLARRHLSPLAASNLVLCVSHHTKGQYLEQLPGYDNAAVLHNTVRSSFVEGDRSAARKKFDVGDAFVLLTVARIDGRRGYKGHDLVLRALAQLQLPSNRPLLYLIAGDGEDQPRLEQLVSELRLKHQVRFLGRVGDDALPDLYRAADLFVMPSSGEGFGIVFIEAMACGTPTIGLDIGGAGEALCDGVLGRAVSLETFKDELQKSIQAADAARVGLSKATRERFGTRRFRAVLANLVQVLRGAQEQVAR